MWEGENSIATQPTAAVASCHGCPNYDSFILYIGAQSSHMAPLISVSNSIGREVCEAYLMKDVGTVIGYWIGYGRLVIKIYNLSKGVHLFAVLTRLSRLYSRLCRSVVGKIDLMFH